MAERELKRLKQFKLASEYTAKFQQYSDQLGWDNRVLANQYYIRLKEFVKDKLTRIDKPDNLQDIIENATKINNRFCKRSLEKKGSYNPGKKQRNGKR
jgi:hypothetical protein